jgi:dipeptidyl aminopeptidase/acylaminoacyl peptidase
LRAEQVTFHGPGARLAGTLLLPDAMPSDAEPIPGIVHGPGWMGLRDARLYVPYHESLTGAGMAVLTLDYRGFGDSEGDATFLDPLGQVDDIRAGLTYLETRPEIDPRRLGAFGSGGTGGGHAVMVAGLDERVKAVVSQVPIADGEDWLRRMRYEDEWHAFRDRVAAAARAHAATGEVELVSPRDGIMVPTPERRTTSIKSDVDTRVPTAVALQSAEAIFRYRPLDVAAAISPRALMLIAVENDAVTPEDHARALYDAAGDPKLLVIQTGTTHYAAYEQYRDVVSPLIVEWFGRHLAAGAPRIAPDDTGPTGVRYLDPPAPGAGTAPAGDRPAATSAA